MATMNPMKHDARPNNPGDRHTDAEKSAADKSTVDKAKDYASDLADKAKDMAKDAAHSAKDMAKDAANTAEKKTDSAIHSVGSGMESLAGSIREKGPHEGTLGSATNRLAQTLESGGHYLKEEGIASIAEDLTDVIRRNPVPALLVGIGLGFLLARATRS